LNSGGANTSNRNTSITSKSLTENVKNALMFAKMQAENVRVDEINHNHSGTWTRYRKKRCGPE